MARAAVQPRAPALPRRTAQPNPRASTPLKESHFFAPSTQGHQRHQSELCRHERAAPLEEALETAQGVHPLSLARSHHAVAHAQAVVRQRRHL
ncbi:hypothetical protein GCM10008949_38100 [Deinococcus humi]|nr:hypothetical protein GCM10008949_38100 [Deinococcus humi]